MYVSYLKEDLVAADDCEERYGTTPYRSTSVALSKSGWEMIQGGVTVRRLLRKLRCFVRGHESVHVAYNVYQCTKCHSVGE